jgi:hypothetical protein
MGPIGCPDASVIASLRCVTSQKSDDHIYSAAEARGHANYVLYPASLASRHPKLIHVPFVQRVGRRRLRAARRDYTQYAVLCEPAMHCIAHRSEPGPAVRKLNIQIVAFKLLQRR